MFSAAIFHAFTDHRRNSWLALPEPVGSAETRMQTTALQIRVHIIEKVVD